MKKKQGVSCLLLLLPLALGGCRMLEDAVAAQVPRIDSVEELQLQLEDILKSGKKEFTFGTKELAKSDLKELNQYHEGFYGTVSSYEYKSFQLLDYAQVTLHCDINENYYVEKALMEEQEIPEDNEKAKELLDICEGILQRVDVDASDYEKEKLFHDYLVDHVEYGYPEGKEAKDSLAYTAYGALAKGRAVCSGYTQAMKLLCDVSGVECGIITGDADGESHAWNLVRLDGELYHVDVTWDDPVPNQPDRVLYSYFNLDDTQMALSHQWNRELYEKAEGTEEQYYRKNGWYYHDIDAFEEGCEKLFRKRSPASFQVMVGDYDKSVYTEERLQFIFRCSGASTLGIEVTGVAPYTTLYIRLEY